MYISSARNFLRRAAANAGDATSHSDAQLDDAIQLVVDDFLRHTGLSAVVTDCTLSIGTDSVTLPAGALLFREERLVLAYLDSSNVVVDTQAGWPDPDLVEGGREATHDGENPYPRKPELDVWTIDRMVSQRRGNPQSGQPVAIAFESARVAYLWPNPDLAYTLKLKWRLPLVTWEPGIPLLTAVLTGTAISAVTVVSGGGGIFTTAPALTFSGGGGTGAAATATLSNGRVTAVGSITGGTGYTSAPTVLAGGYDATDQLLNLADDYLREVLKFGGVHQLLINDAKRQKIAESAWAKYIDFRTAFTNTAAPARHRAIRRY